MKHQQLFKLVEQAYLNTDQDFGAWMWANHVPIVAKKAEEFAVKFKADVDLTVAGALLHDFGDAFVHRFDQNHDQITRQEGTKLLTDAGFSDQEIVIIFDQIIAFHSCRPGAIAQTLEAKVVATADAYAHLMTDFYLQVCWKNIPELYSYTQWKEWVREKLSRDQNVKIFFDEIKGETQEKYQALIKVMVE